MTKTNGPSALLERLQSGKLLVSRMAPPAPSCSNTVSSPGDAPRSSTPAIRKWYREMARQYFAAGLRHGPDQLLRRQRIHAEKVRIWGAGSTEFNRLAAQNTSAPRRPRDGYVVGSVGPTGEFLEPLGPVLGRRDVRRLSWSRSGRWRRVGPTRWSLRR